MTRFRFSVPSVAVVAGAGMSISAQTVFNSGGSQTINSRINDTVSVTDAGDGTPTEVTIVSGGDVGRTGFFAPTDSLFVEGTSSVLLDGGRIRRDALAFDGSSFLLTSGRIDRDLLGFDDSMITVDAGIINRDLDMNNSSSARVNGGTIRRDILAFNSSTIDIFGGTVENDIVGFQDSVINIFGGVTVEEDLVTFDDALMNVTGGTFLDDVIAEERSTITITGGSFDDDVEAVDDSTVNISGGSFGEDVEAINGGTINVFGGTFATGGLGNQDFGFLADTGSTITVYGTGFTIDGVSVDFGEITALSGVLGGTLLDGSSLLTNFTRQPVPGQLGTIVLIPTPGSVAMLGLAGMVAGTRRRRG